MSLLDLFTPNRRESAASRADCLARYTQPLTRWMVLHGGSNPSTDYYIRPRVDATHLPVLCRSLDADPPAEEDLSPGTFVIVVRYLNRSWSRALKRAAGHLAGLALFMDEDLWDEQALESVSSGYRRSIGRHALAHKPVLQDLLSHLWVCSPMLEAKYAAQGACRLDPMPLVGERPPQVQPADDVVRIFYHGSQSHMGELEWLRPVLKGVLDDCPQVHVEVIGDRRVHELYGELPRTRVLHPMSWPNYLSHCRTLGGHIGLAPLLPTRFNAARAPTKALDIARASAVGIYSEEGPYGQVIQTGVNGLLLAHDPDLWRRCLRDLVHNRRRLTALRAESVRLLAAQPRPADPLLELEQGSR